MFINIINYLKDNKLPKTIYKSYLLKKYLEDNKLPNHFSYKNKTNLELLSSKYKMTKKLFEVMKTYDMLLSDFVEELNNSTIEPQLKKIYFIHYLSKD
jgi:hypothetical protein